MAHLRDGVVRMGLAVVGLVVVVSAALVVMLAGPLPAAANNHGGATRRSETFSTTVHDTVTDLAPMQRNLAQDRTRAIAVVNGTTVFDQTVDGAPTSPAGQAVIEAAKDAARRAGASDASIAAGTTSSTGTSNSSRSETTRTLDRFTETVTLVGPRGNHTDVI